MSSRYPGVDISVVPDKPTGPGSLEPNMWTAVAKFDSTTAYDASGKTIELALASLCEKLANSIYRNKV